jgi:chemotaxis protein histidine kinase CheA
MTRKVIEEMGGKVSFESSEGKGSRVTLLVPVALAVKKDADTPADPRNAPQ